MSTVETPLRRGEVVVVNLDPVLGHEIGRTRPAVVIQNDVGNRYSPTAIVAALTSHSDRKAMFPFCVAVDKGEGGLSQTSIVNTAQIRTVDKRRIVGQPLGRLSASTMLAVDTALRMSLGLY